MSEGNIKGGVNPHSPNPAQNPAPAKPPVPAGLEKCRKCGRYKGRCMQDGKQWDISCCCNPHICERCNTPVHKYRICSNFYDEQDGRCWRVPIHCAWAHRCPDGVLGQLGNSFLINPRTGEDLLKRAHRE